MKKKVNAWTALDDGGMRNSTLGWFLSKKLVGEKAILVKTKGWANL